jgi:methylated-DNA-protein-cysteine methyltransferase-like protein
MDANYRKRVFQLVRRIPSGRVMTYGQIAAILGEGYTPRTVGFVMHSSEQEDVPWQRVINSQGACSTMKIVLPANRQQGMLEQEGVKFDTSGRCDLRQYLWEPKVRQTKAKATLFKKPTATKSRKK